MAGDRGAPPIPLGGGTGDAAGNANALASRNPIQNKRKYRPITYGSSHIQAISFLPGGRTDARTILTYSQDGEPAVGVLVGSDAVVLAGEVGAVRLDGRTDPSGPGPDGESDRLAAGT